MKTALVVGGSSGLGAAVIAALADSHRLVEFSRSAPYDFSQRLDLGDTAASLRTFMRAVRTACPTTVEGCTFYHCAASYQKTQWNSDVTAAGGERELRANITTPMQLIRHLVSYTEAAGIPTTIVVVTSGLATIGRAGCALYSMSKAALERLLESYHEESRLGHYRHCHFVTVDPGMFISPLHHKVITSTNHPFPVLDDMRAAARSGLPEAAAVGRHLVAAVATARTSGLLRVEL